ncbi:peptide chain release factor N(5)-glutamine methyltransferase [Anditalea andensis]|uniref:peptide chain release factor N(5)-glutamine methyltransferase n=1 Tax=Anditalea andensis TaxID=1048983 RepID=A0A074LHU4_9BACT|nr:peptide chain release factor N(5)-glutamine methyltransferase [Anditalea andensis]KEO73367.1 protein-(glutamine-N5) methyltransferase [Anditalea andensis]
MTTSSRELFKNYSEQLKPLYSEQEANSITFWLLEQYLGATRKDILVNKYYDLGESAIEGAFQKVLTGVPIQQVLGWAPFYGREFNINPQVLIPRNETEELVHFIIQETKLSEPRILDIGTGSGCIPITLALEIPDAKLFAVDISPGAIKVAKENALLLKAAVQFYQLDILSEDLPFQDLDLIISNPPYVRESEKKLMHRNVLDHEPHLALFVTDEDPLLFYREISKKAIGSLKTGGKLYFEINEAFVEETRQTMENLGFKNVKALQDLNGKFRIVSGSREA